LESRYNNQDNYLPQELPWRFCDAKHDRFAEDESGLLVELVAIYNGS